MEKVQRFRGSPFDKELRVSGRTLKPLTGIGFILGER